MLTEKRKSRSVFDDVLYAQCWEDPDLDRSAFRMTPEDVLFTITSGGCNTLAFLLDDPLRVYALDLNPHQNHLLNLKAESLRTFAYGELLEFLGVIPSHQRSSLYLRVRDALPNDARVFWDGKPEHIERGIIHCGRFESYIRFLGSLTRTIVGLETVREFFAGHPTEKRRALYEQHWHTLRWTACTRLFLSRQFMSLFFDKAFFAQLTEDFSFGKHFEHKIRHALTELPLWQSPFLSYALLGYYQSHSSLPVYLREENTPIIRARLDRISVSSEDCTSFFRSLPAGSISKFNFSNIFEWMPASDFETLLQETVRVATDGAVMTYRNLLVPRSHPLSLEGVISSRQEEAETLHNNDLSFLYRSYIIEDIQSRKENHVHRHPSCIESV